jgi:CubicO group peptidase (beta-lactamase class C family)
MRFRSTLVAFMIGAPATAIGAQQAGITAIPDSVVTRIDRAFAGLGGREAPGCAIGVSQAGNPVLTRAYGMANLEYDVPNTPATIFESGSVAKQFTAATVVLLAQEG